MDGFFLKLSSTISNEDFRQEARKASCDFVRNRKLPLFQLVLMILKFSRNGIQTELNRFSTFILTDQNKILTCTKSAFSQARKKLSVHAFEYLNKFILRCFYQEAPYRSQWKGFFPVAIDGSTLTLPECKELIDHFKGCYNQTRKIVSTARISMAYDILNKLILDVRNGAYTTSEGALAREHLAELDPQKHLLVFDRLYPSFNFFLQLNQMGFKYCFRLSRNWTQAYMQLRNNDDVIWCLKRNMVYRHGKERLRLEEDFAVRLVKIRLSSGTEEVLLTNLFEDFNVLDLKHLYAMRWQIEETYKRMKQVAQIEYFSGKTVQAIEQDIYARVVMLNIASLIETQSLQVRIEEDLIDKIVRYKQQVNRTQVYLMLRDQLYSLLLAKQRLSIDSILELLLSCKDIVRDGRSFPRNIARKPPKKPLNYKA